MPKPKSKKIWLYVFYMALTVAILVFVLGMNDIGAIGQALKSTNMTFVLIAILLLIVYFLLYPIPLSLLARAKKLDVKSLDVYLIGMTEHFFNGITPFATGGQPFQAYALAKKKVKVADSTGLLIMNFVIFMIVTNTFALFSLFYYNEFISSTGMGVVAIIGFSMNFLVLLSTIAVGTSKTVKKLIVKLMTLIAKIKFLKKLLEPRIKDFETYADNTQSAFKELWKYKGTCISCFLIKAATMFIYYAITFFVIKALNIEITPDKLFFVICGTAFAITMVVFLPTPGSSGGIELAFSSIFIALGMPTTASYTGMLIWRLITYYLTIALSFLAYVLFEFKLRRTLKKEQDNGETAPDLRQGSDIEQKTDTKNDEKNE